MTALLRLPEVMQRTGMCRATVYADMAAGKFPRALKRGRASLWVEAEIEAFVAEQIATLPRMGQSMGRPTRGNKKAA